MRNERFLSLFKCCRFGLGSGFRPGLEIEQLEKCDQFCVCQNAGAILDMGLSYVYSSKIDDVRLLVGPGVDIFYPRETSPQSIMTR